MEHTEEQEEEGMPCHWTPPSCLGSPLVALGKTLVPVSRPEAPRTPQAECHGKAGEKYIFTDILIHYCGV